MELSLKVTATQLTKEDKIFLGQEVRGKDEKFCFIPANGDHVKVNEGFWVIEYHDGYREVWSDEQIKNNSAPFKPIEIDLAEIENITMGSKGEIMTPKDVLDLFFQTGVLLTRKNAGIDEQIEAKSQEPDLAEDIRIDDETPIEPVAEVKVEEPETEQPQEPKSEPEPSKDAE